MIKRASIAIVSLTLIGNIIFQIFGPDRSNDENNAVATTCSPTDQVQELPNAEPQFIKSFSGTGDRSISLHLEAGTYRVHQKIEDSSLTSAPFLIEVLVTRSDGASTPLLGSLVFSCSKYNTLQVGQGLHDIEPETIAFSIKTSNSLRWSITLEWQSVTVSGHGYARRPIELYPGAYDVSVRKHANQRLTSTHPFDVVAIDSRGLHTDLGDPTASSKGTKGVMIGGGASDLRPGTILFEVNTYYKNRWQLTVSRSVQVPQ